MSNAEKAREFPIQPQLGAKSHPTKIPWWLADLAYSVYSATYGKEQSLERLAERGGFGPGEMDEFVPNWREQASAFAAVVKERDEARSNTFWKAGMELAEKNRILREQLHEANSDACLWNANFMALQDSTTDIIRRLESALAYAKEVIDALIHDEPVHKPFEKIERLERGE